MDKILRIPGVENKLFGTFHIIMIVLCLLIIVGLTIFSCKKLTMDKFHRLLLIVGITSEAIKAITYVINGESTYGGYLSKDNLPLHLCSVQVIFIIILNFSKNEKLKRIIHSFMLPTTFIGGVGAVVFTTWSSLNLWPITITYFLYHCCLASFSIYLLTRKSEEERLTIKDYKSGLIMFFALVLIAIYVNSILYERYSVLDDAGNLVDKFESVNFMYVISPPGGLEFAKQWGWGPYFLIYSATWLLGFSLLYIKQIIDAIKKRMH